MPRPLLLRRYLTELQTRGVPAAEVLRGSGVLPEMLDDPACVVDLDAYLRVIANAIRLGGDDGLGLRMGLARETADFRILGHAAMACRTVRESMEDYWYKYGDALGMLAKISFSGGRSDVLVGHIEAAQVSGAVHRFLVEETLALVLTVGAQVSGLQPHFEFIELAYERPAYWQRYRALFQCPVSFGAPANRVALSRRWLDHPLPGSDDELRGVLQHNLDRLKREIEAGSTASEQLRQWLVRSGTRVPSLEECARQLGLSPRTLRRRLQLEGCSYSGVLASHRKALALAALEGEGLSAKQLSERAGFEDVNAFRRAFKKWTGRTVRGWRDA